MIFIDYSCGENLLYASTAALTLDFGQNVPTYLSRHCEGVADNK